MTKFFATFLDDGTLLATISKDETIIIWSVNPGRWELKWRCQMDGQYCWDYLRCHFNGDNSQILVTGRGCIYPAQLEAVVFILAPKELETPVQWARKIEVSMATLQWIDNGRILLSTVLPGPEVDVQLLSIESLCGPITRLA